MYSIVTAVLFDMDGTLVDTEPVGPQLMDEMMSACSAYGNDDRAEFVRVWRRLGDAVSTAEFVQRRLGEDTDEFLSAFYSAYVNRLGRSKQLPGAQQALDWCARQGFAKGLVSASSIEQIDAILLTHGWQNAFEVVLSQDHYIVSKPNPACWRMAADHLGVAPHQCIVVEDSLNGARAARSAGMRVIGVTAGNTELADAMEMAGTNDLVDKLIPSLVELPEALGGRNNA